MMDEELKEYEDRIQQLEALLDAMACHSMYYRSLMAAHDLIPKHSVFDDLMSEYVKDLQARSKVN